MDKSGEEANLECIRMPYSAPQIIIEFELEASAGGGVSGNVLPRPDGVNIYNPWELP